MDARKDQLYLDVRNSYKEKILKCRVDELKAAYTLLCQSNLIRARQEEQSCGQICQETSGNCSQRHGVIGCEITTNVSKDNIEFDDAAYVHGTCRNSFMKSPKKFHRESSRILLANSRLSKSDGGTIVLTCPSRISRELEDDTIASADDRRDVTDDGMYVELCCLLESVVEDRQTLTHQIESIKEVMDKQIFDLAAEVEQKKSEIEHLRAEMQEQQLNYAQSNNEKPLLEESISPSMSNRCASCRSSDAQHNIDIDKSPICLKRAEALGSGFDSAKVIDLYGLTDVMLNSNCVHDESKSTNELKEVNNFETCFEEPLFQKSTHQIVDSKRMEDMEMEDELLESEVCEQVVRNSVEISAISNIQVEQADTEATEIVAEMVNKAGHCEIKENKEPDKRVYEYAEESHHQIDMLGEIVDTVTVPNEVNLNKQIEVEVAITLGGMLEKISASAASCYYMTSCESLNAAGSCEVVQLQDEKLEPQMDGLPNQIADLEQKCRNLSVENARLELQLLEAQTSTNDQIETCQSENASLLNTIGNLSSTIEKLAAENADLRSNVEALRCELDSSIDECRDQTNTATSLFTRLEEEERKCHDWCAKVKDLNELLGGLQQEKTELGNRLVTSESSGQKLHEENLELMEELYILRTELNVALEEKMAAVSRLQSAERQVERVQGEHRDLQDELSLVNTELERLHVEKKEAVDKAGLLAVELVQYQREACCSQNSDSTAASLSQRGTGVTQLLSEISTLQAEKQNLESKLNEKSEELDCIMLHAGEETQTNASNLHSLKIENESLHNELLLLEKRLDDKSKHSVVEIESLKKQVQNLTAIHESLKWKVNGTEKENVNLRSRIASLMAELDNVDLLRTGLSTLLDEKEILQNQLEAVGAEKAAELLKQKQWYEEKMRELDVEHLTRLAAESSGAFAAFNPMEEFIQPCQRQEQENVVRERLEYLEKVNSELVAQLSAVQNQLSDRTREVTELKEAFELKLEKLRTEISSSWARWRESKAENAKLRLQNMELVQNCACSEDTVETFIDDSISTGRPLGSGGRNVLRDLSVKKFTHQLNIKNANQESTYTTGQKRQACSIMETDEGDCKKLHNCSVSNCNPVCSMILVPESPDAKSQRATDRSVAPVLPSHDVIHNEQTGRHSVATACVNSPPQHCDNVVSVKSTTVQGSSLSSSSSVLPAGSTNLRSSSITNLTTGERDSTKSKARLSLCFNKNKQ